MTLKRVGYVFGWMVFHFILTLNRTICPNMVKLVGKMRYTKLLDYYSYYHQISG